MIFKYRFLHCFFTLIICCLIASSCISRKKIIYIQDKNINNTTPVEIKNKKADEYKIEANDILNIKITSLDARTSAFFNIEPTSAAGSQTSSPSGAYYSGYSINDSGNVYIPVIGSVKAQGLTIKELQDSIQKQLNEHVQDGIVLVRLANFKITFLGEVHKPGTQYVYSNQLTIYEGIGMAGELTDLGNRKKVKLVRQIGDTTSIIYIDLTDPKIIASEYYYLRPNDILYVENFKAKQIRFNISPISVVLGLVSTVLVIYNIALRTVQ